MPYIHELEGWPHFSWDYAKLAEPLAQVRLKQGRLLGKMENLGFELRQEASLQSLTTEIVKSNEIEGKSLDVESVRSSIARRMGLEDVPPASKDVEGVVEMMLDATEFYIEELSLYRLHSWHAGLFPTGRSGMREIKVGAWRDAKSGPMQVVSGPMGNERVHFEAPDCSRLETEMNAFLDWFNGEADMDKVLKAGLAHLWFVIIHPYEDGNGRIARAITEMQLARSENCAQRFYSMSNHIRADRKAYYQTLEFTQKGDLDVTDWLLWFLACLEKALDGAESLLNKVLQKAEFWKNNKSTFLNERQKDMLNRLLDGFEGKLTSSKWAKIQKCSQDTASRDINDLIEKGVLKKGESGGRSTSYDLI